MFEIANSIYGRRHVATAVLAFVAHAVTTNRLPHLLSIAPEVLAQSSILFFGHVLAVSTVFAAGVAVVLAIPYSMLEARAAADVRFRLKAIGTGELLEKGAIVSLSVTTLLQAERFGDGDLIGTAALGYGLLLVAHVLQPCFDFTASPQFAAIQPLPVGEGCRISFGLGRSVKPLIVQRSLESTVALLEDNDWKVSSTHVGNGDHIVLRR